MATSRKYLCNRKNLSNFAALLKLIDYRDMKDLGIILVLLGVLCLVLYSFCLPSNGLLIASLVLEVIGIFAYIFFNRRHE